MKNKTICFYDFKATSVSRDADMVSLGIVAVTEKFTDYKKLTIENFQEAISNAKDSERKFIDGTIKGEGIYKQIESIYEPEIKTMYCEFTNFNIDKCDDWVRENIVDKLSGFKSEPLNINANNVSICGDSEFISKQLKEWLSQFEEVEFWADFDVIDKPMLIDLIADWDMTKPDGFIFTSKEESEEFKSKYGSIKTSYVYKIGLPKHLPNIKYDQFFDIHTLFKIKGINTDINREEFVGIKDDLVPFEMQSVRGLNSHNALWDAYVSYLAYDKLMKM